MLRIHFSDNQQAPVWVAGESFAIGSASDNDLVLNHPQVAAQHAVIRQENGHYYLSDSHSGSGTFVNGERINSHYQLRDGDKLTIGSVELTLADPSRSSLKLAPKPPRWVLQVLKGEQEGHKFPITGSMTFGRSIKCELCFSDMELSRRHCEFFLKNDILEVKDLASANGVFVNDSRVATAVLQSGDRVRMGSVTLMVIGPKVDVQEQAQEDATRFIKVADLPLPSTGKKSSGIPLNPLVMNNPQGEIEATAKHTAGLLWALLAVVIVAAVLGVWWLS